MSYRLPADANLIGYWGFDEATETDLALDEGLGARHLTVTSSPGVEAGRLGNARTFNGASTFASPASSTAFQLIGDMTIITWFQLSSYNSTGSLLRTIVSCDGPLTSDNVLYSLSVDSSGRLIYRHTGSTGLVQLRTTVSRIVVNQVYNIVIRRIASGVSNQDIELYIDNKLIAWTDITVNAVPSSMPVPKPIANASATLKFGKSNKDSDSAFWHGFIDESSIHDTVRTYSPYLTTAYFSHTIANPTNKLTAGGDVKNIASYEMGGGVRWWCFERNGDLYVTKETSFGKFGTETQLTTVGGGSYTGAGKPELIYDSATDTLYVFFIAGNRVYKLTASAVDNPAVQNMPFTANSGSIVKSLDHQDAGSFGNGGGQRDPLESDMVYVNRSPIKLSVTDDLASVGNGGGDQFTVTPGTPNVPFLNFTDVPALGGFGLAIGSIDVEMSGFAVYHIEGDTFVQLGTPVRVADFYYVNVPVRTYGSVYVAEALDVKGRKSGVFSVAVVDNLGEIATSNFGAVLIWGRESDGTDAGSFGNGGGQRDILESDITYVNRSPIKLSVSDDLYGVGNGGGQLGSVTQNGVTVVIYE